MYKNIDKANRHLHLTGALTAIDTLALCKISKIQIPVQIANTPPRTFFNNDPYWMVIKDAISTVGGLSEAIKLVGAREAKDNCKYIEITINPVGIIKRGLTYDNFFIAIKNASVDLLSSRNMICKYKFGINRKDGISSIKIVKDLYNRCSPELKVCIDLNGNERKYPTKLFLPALKELIESGHAISVHVGEYKGLTKSLKDVINLKPSRIAHGIAGFMDSEILNLIQENNIMLEISPSSNLALNTISGDYQIALTTIINSGIKVVLGTDDPAFFKNSISSECELLEKKFGISKNKIESILLDGLNLKDN
jgi:adenosine deaminase